MSVIYQYVCSTENNLITEERDENDPVPTVCKNEGSAIVNGTLSIFRQPEILEDVNFNGNGRFDFNNAVLRDISHTKLDDIGLYNHSEIDNHIDNTNIHTTIDDETTSINSTWSSNKIHTTINSININSLSDVEINTPVSGQAITFNGLNWINDNISGGSGMDLSDVTFEAYLDLELSINNNWTDLVFNKQRIINPTYYSYNLYQSNITINQSGRYYIIATVSTHMLLSNSRTIAQARLMLNSGSGFSEIGGTRGCLYIRKSSQGMASATLHATLDLSGGDQIKVQVQRVSGGGSIITYPDGCRITLHKLG
jgi:hypothetical protein